ncbi:uncharacterized protein LOC106632881 [Haplochromis burtoni]|uniref:uncharacterized protein LOC106632881 n=1 Tax=Haplochromis burtoni TaxID=8153 RepID=UPI0006C9ACAE|nr:uncharacterized protein LOC106632881 [Haplochromis burtoni]
MYEKYLSKSNIPLYPGPKKFSPEFHASYLKHDTHRFSLQGIKNDEGFKDPNHGSEDPDGLSLVWFSLAVQENEIQSAEQTLLKKTNMHAEPGFLKKLASSPAFSEKSRYGSYRFTFMVQEVLKAYSEQFCSGEQPCMRVLRTSLYRQEVMYAVLVHSPDKNQRFKDSYPEVSDHPDAVCAYRDGHFIWRPQAMCETHRYELTVNGNGVKAEKATEPHQWYVWDHITIALLVEDGKVLKFGSDVLLQRLTFCKKDQVIVAPRCYDSRDLAENWVKTLWGETTFELKEESSSVEESALEERFEDLSLLDEK